jgi:uncharacterized protein with HEPN domain
MKDDRFFLLHIRDAIEKILTYCQDGETAFLADPRTQDAVIRNIEIIGEATKNISDPLRATYPTVPWKQIARMRDFLIHHYFGVKLALVWEVVSKDLPFFQKEVQTILESLAPPASSASETPPAS